MLRGSNDLGVMGQSVMAATRRSYGQACALARALDVVGERWTLLVVRELLFGPRRFGELLGDLPGIGPNLLSARLKSLADGHLARRVALGRGGVGYELTESGQGLEPVLLGLARWELERDDVPEEIDQVRPRWGLLALRARFRSGLGEGLTEVYQLDVDGQPYRLAVRGGTLEATAGPDPAATVVLGMTSTILARLALGAVALEAAATAGEVQVRGSPFAVARFARVFDLEGAAR